MQASPGDVRLDDGVRGSGSKGTAPTRDGVNVNPETGTPGYLGAGREALHGLSKKAGVRP